MAIGQQFCSRSIAFGPTAPRSVGIVQSMIDEWFFLVGGGFLSRCVECHFVRFCLCLKAICSAISDNPILHCISFNCGAEYKRRYVDRKTELRNSILFLMSILHLKNVIQNCQPDKLTKREAGLIHEGTLNRYKANAQPTTIYILCDCLCFSVEQSRIHGYARRVRVGSGHI